MVFTRKWHSGFFSEYIYYILLFLYMAEVTRLHLQHFHSCSYVTSHNKNDLVYIFSAYLYIYIQKICENNHNIYDKVCTYADSAIWTNERPIEHIIYEYNFLRNIYFSVPYPVMIFMCKLYDVQNSLITVLLQIHTFIPFTELSHSFSLALYLPSPSVMSACLMCNIVWWVYI